MSMMHRMMQTARASGADFLNALSPVRIHQVQQFRNLGARASTGMRLRTANYADPASSMLARKTASWRWQQGRTHMGKIGAVQTMKKYWAGEWMDTAGVMSSGRGRVAPSNVFSDRHGLSSQMYRNIMRRNAIVRRTAIAAIGGATLGTAVFGANSLPSQMGQSATAVGATGLAAAGALEIGARTRHPMVGGLAAAALAGGSVYNMLRSGNQVGPF